MHIPGITTTRLHLFLAASLALTGSTYALTVAVLVLAVTLMRVWTRHRLVGWPAALLVPVGAGVLGASTADGADVGGLSGR
jgi:hypothetical protein